MNIAFFLTPKNMVAYVYDDFTVKQGLEKLRRSGYTAIPVITRDSRYAGTVSEGDFLWYLADNWHSGGFSERSLENVSVRDMMRNDIYPPVRITAAIEELITRSVNQNFVPVIDDNDLFIGIITRRNILKYFFRANRIKAETGNPGEKEKDAG